MTRRLAGLTVALLITCGWAGAFATQTPAGGTETDRLVRAVLETSFRSGGFPDSGLLRRSAIVPIVTDVDGLLTHEALPQLAEWQFELRSRAELEADATKAKQNIYYASVARVRIDGQTATLWIGVSFVEPSDRPPVPRLCCCGSQIEYQKVNGRWVYAKTLSMVCA